MPRNMLTPSPSASFGNARQSLSSTLGLGVGHLSSSKPASSFLTQLPLTSESMSRSLSAFSSSASDMALNPRYYSRSSSAQGVPKYQAGQVTLDSLIQAELGRPQGTSDTSTAPGDPGLTSRGTSASDTNSMPTTTSEISVVSKSSLDVAQTRYKPQHRSTRSDLGLMASSRPSGPRSPVSSTAKHAKSSSVPLAALPDATTVHDRMKRDIASILRRAA